MYANNAIFLIIALITLFIIIGAWIAVRMLKGRLNFFVEKQPASGQYYAQQPVLVAGQAPAAGPAKKSSRDGKAKSASSASSDTTEEPV
jgi:hypothetical protein